MTLRRTFLKMAGASALMLACPAGVLAGFDPQWNPDRPVARPIDVSLLDIFQIGPGPSSSHTIAPMRAGNDFLGLMRGLPERTLEQADSLTVQLFGGLSAAGRRHGTDKAVAAGLLGVTPESCTATFMDGLFARPDDVRTVQCGARALPFGQKNVTFSEGGAGAPRGDVLRIRLWQQSRVLLEREYRSVGGGFLEWQGWKAPERGVPRHVFDSMNGLLALCASGQRSLPQIMLENETDITGMQPNDVREKVAYLIRAMDASVEAGLNRTGRLKGPYPVDRRAAGMLHLAGELPAPEDRFLARLSACAHAAAEENADGHPVVTAPTAGAAGVMAAAVHLLRRERDVSDDRLVDGLLAAAAVGMLAKRHASLAGADVGCQGEIGVASAMTAALLAQVSGAAPDVVENAAELALEHHLGMTCDPVGGYVQIPCISRCAMGAAKAWNAWLMARAGMGTRHPVGLDLTIRAMNATGRDLDEKYRGTSRGGLALYYTQGC